ncbi:hypothetical protein EVAR_7659_1 [Eumeta japonica]|uniref:Uncharacterized protein n=1 Tax=Eumeta variegata TaxID=151549 RepID=A0A4C1TJD4_EUMVA|nr:hypothetical protein EVAR_7659_1 [Eumeta japonica]
MQYLLLLIIEPIRLRLLRVARVETARHVERGERGGRGRRAVGAHHAAALAAARAAPPSPVSQPQVAGARPPPLGPRSSSPLRPARTRSTYCYVPTFSMTKLHRSVCDSLQTRFPRRCLTVHRGPTLFPVECQSTRLRVRFLSLIANVEETVFDYISLRRPSAQPDRGAAASWRGASVRLGHITYGMCVLSSQLPWRSTLASPLRLSARSSVTTLLTVSTSLLGLRI